MANAPALSAPVGRPNPWPWVALSVAMVAAAAVALVALLRDGGSSSPVDHRAKIGAVVQPIAPANDALSDDLNGLAAGDSPDAALASATVALRDTRAATMDLTTLRLPSDAFGLRADSEDALAREASYLVAVRNALSERSSAPVERKANAARSAWRRLAREIPGAGGRIGGIGALVAWVDAAAAVADADGAPTIPDGDAGPGDETADLPAAPSVHFCGNATGVSDVVGEGVGCAEAFDIAAKAPVAKNAAGVGGYICSTGSAGAQGVKWTCDGPAGERVRFYAVDP